MQIKSPEYYRGLLYGGVGGPIQWVDCCIIFCYSSLKKNWKGKGKPAVRMGVDSIPRAYLSDFVQVLELG